MNSENELSSRDYEREARNTRYRLAASLDELNDRLTPGQVFDEMLTYAKGGGGTFFRALTNAARENPIPSLLIGAGCMLFLSDKMGLSRFVEHHDGDDSAVRGAASGARRRVVSAGRTAADATASMTDSARSRFRSARECVSEQASNVGEEVKQGTGAVGDTVASVSHTASEAVRDGSRTVADAARAVRDQAADTTEQLTHAARGAADTTLEYSAALGGHVTERATRARRQASDTARRVKASTMSLIHDQPLLCAALGLAVGAAIAAALPSTDSEDDLMGGASDALKDKMGEVASEQLENAKAAAGKAAQAAGTAALREGLSGSGAADIARGVGERVKRIVTEAASAGTSEFRSRTGFETQS